MKLRNLRRGMTLMIAGLCLWTMPKSIWSQAQEGPQKVFIDSDMGDDIDDAYAVALAMRSPELHVVGISSACGETALRARMIQRIVETVNSNRPVVGEGIAAHCSGKFSQKQWAADGHIDANIGNGVDLLQQEILKYPGQLTVVALGPQGNLEALLKKDPATFHKIQRIVMMGGAIYQGYDPGSKPVAEYNIAQNASAFRSVLASGVPIEMMPLDSTVVLFSKPWQDKLYAVQSDTTAMLKELTREWITGQDRTVPTLFDVVPVAALIHPAICPVKPMRIEATPKGFTKPVKGAPNVKVCLKVDEAAMLKLVVSRLSAR